MSTLFQPGEVYNAVRRLADWPGSRCPLCSTACPPRRLCAACVADLPRRPHLPLGLALPGVDAVYALCSYRYPLPNLILSAKFQRDLATLSALAQQLAAEVSDSLPAHELVVPIPLAGGRYLRRGYNQAVELARPLAALTGAAFIPEVLYRARGGVAQSALPPASRRRNLRDAFAYARRVDVQHALLVDDVITSGSTIAAAAAALRAAGARRISAVVLATAWEK